MFHFNFHRKHIVSWVPEESSSLATNFPAKHKFNRRLREGAEGIVEQWIHIETHTVLAVKVIRHDKKSVPNEVHLLRNLPHNCIIQCLGYFLKQPSADKSSIMLEYCPEGDLLTIRGRMMKCDNGIFAESFMWSVYNQLASAFAFLHEGIDSQNPLGRDNWRPVVHGDMKMENVLVKSLGSKDDWSTIDLKLGDFGMAEYYDPANPNPLGHIGTTHNWPPEVTWETKKLSPASDMWGIAAILHELAHCFGPVVSPEITKKKWLAENVGAPYPEYWPKLLKINYWGAKSPRRVVPINLSLAAPLPAEACLDEPDEHVEMLRKHRPSPKYSDALNDCMMMALKFDPQERAGAGELLSQIEEVHADFLFQDLKIEYECSIQDVDKSGGEDEY
ncbi:Nn.00g004050.m01.CDS01 [Neocucurbitaria sp. VM-36]